MSHSYMAHARGTVAAVNQLGEIAVAEIDWKNGADADLPRKVVTANLAVVGPNTRFCQC